MNKLFIALALIFLSGITHCATGQSVGVLPSILEFKLGPGESGAQLVKVINNSSARQTLEVGLGDWIRDSTGAHQYFEADTLPNSCAKFVTFTPSFLEIEGGQSAEVLVNFTMPAEGPVADQMTWTMLFISGTSEKTDPFVADGVMATQINSNFRFGIHVYNTPPSVGEESAKVVKLEHVNDTTITLLMENTGKTMLTCNTFVELTHLETGKKWKSEEEEIVVFPGFPRKAEFIIPEGIEPGEYAVLGLLDYSKSKSLEAREILVNIE